MCSLFALNLILLVDPVSHGCRQEHKKSHSSKFPSLPHSPIPHSPICPALKTACAYFRVLYCKYKQIWLYFVISLPGFYTKGSLFYSRFLYQNRKCFLILFLSCFPPPPRAAQCCRAWHITIHLPPHLMET